MPRGQPDYGEYAVKEVAASVSDMGEVAARLGSIVTFDKRGDVVDFDNFEEPVLKWGYTYYDALSTVYLSSDNPKSGSQSVRFYVPAVVGNWAYIFKTTSPLGSKNIGVEISFSAIHGAKTLEILLEHYDGEYLRKAGARFHQSEGKLYIEDENYSWLEVANIGDTLYSVFVYYTMKLVCNFDTGKYSRLLFSNRQIDLSNKAIWKTADTSAPSLTQYIRTEVLGSANTVCFLDDFVLTQAEP